MSSISAQDSGKEDDLLRLSVLPLMDKIGTLDYRYLSESISVTINERLKKIFEYKPYKNSKARSYLRKLLKKEKKKKKKCLRLAPCAGRWSDIKDSHLLKLTQDKKIDVIIYGEYKGSEFDKEGHITTMLIRVGVFLSSENKTYWIDDEIPLDSSLFDVIEEIADDVVVEINGLLSGKSRAKEASSVQSDTPTPRGKERKALIRFKGNANDDINELLEDEMEEFSDYMSSEHNLEFLSMSDFHPPPVRGGEYFAGSLRYPAHPTLGNDISKKKILRKWMRYFNIPNLVELKVKKEELFITLEAIDQGKRVKKYKLDTRQEKKERIWSRMARGFRDEILSEEQIGKKRVATLTKSKKSLTKKKLKERSEPSSELGFRVGYLHPVLMGNFPRSQLSSAGGYSIEAYYSHRLSDSPLSFHDLYLPELYAFAAFEKYQMGGITEDRSVVTTRVVLGFGLLYSFHFLQKHSLKAGSAMSLGFESLAIEDVGSASSALLSAHILVGYGFLYKNINLSFFSRTSFNPGTELSVLGFSLSLGAGYPVGWF